MARLRAPLGTDIGVRDLFEAPTVAALAARIEHAGAEPAAARRCSLPARRGPTGIPLSLAQQRMWFLNQFDTTSAAYNIPIVVRLTGDLDGEALGLGAHRRRRPARVAAHRCSRSAADEPVQQILPAAGALPDA